MPTVEKEAAAVPEDMLAIGTLVVERLMPLLTVTNSHCAHFPSRCRRLSSSNLSLHLPARGRRACGLACKRTKQVSKVRKRAEESAEERLQVDR